MAVEGRQGGKKEVGSDRARNGQTEEEATPT